MSDHNDTGTEAPEDFDEALADQLDSLAQKTQKNNKILVVDDELAIVEEISGDLRIEGFECVTAPEGTTGLQQVLDNPDISIVITDIRMPSMDGLEMIRRIRQAVGEREIAFIVLTGHGGFDDAVEALRLEAFEFLSKPVSLAHLLHVVNLAREMCDLKKSEKNLKDFLITETRRRARQVQALQEELEQVKARAGRSNESRRRSLHVKNLMRENEALKARLEGLEKSK